MYPPMNDTLYGNPFKGINPYLFDVVLTQPYAWRNDGHRAFVDALIAQFDSQRSGFEEEHIITSNPLWSVLYQGAKQPSVLESDGAICCFGHPGDTISMLHGWPLPLQDLNSLNIASSKPVQNGVDLGKVIWFEMGSPTNYEGETMKYEGGKVEFGRHAKQHTDKCELLRTLGATVIDFNFLPGSRPMIDHPAIPHYPHEEGSKAYHMTIAQGEQFAVMAWGLEDEPLTTPIRLGRRDTFNLSVAQLLNGMHNQLMPNYRRLVDYEHPSLLSKYYREDDREYMENTVRQQRSLHHGR
jgi:hypothetical protein